MRETRPVGRRSLTALICSLLMVFQPVFGAPAPLVTGALDSDEQIQVNRTPALAGTIVHTMSVALLFLSHPEPNNDADLIAVAKLIGTAERNGLPLLNGSIVSSGDSLSTHRDSAVLLTAAPQEILWLGPATSAKLTKDAGNVTVALQRGTVRFQTRGHIQLTFEEHYGLTIRSHSDSPVLAQLSFLNNQKAQVHLQEGSLELVRGKHTLLLQPEQAGLLSATGAASRAAPPAQPESGAQGKSASQASKGSIKGIVVDSQSTVVSGADVTLTSAAGETFKTVSDQEGYFKIIDVPAGSYTLHVTRAGHRSFELRDVVVQSGNESTMFVQLGGPSAAGMKSNGLLIGLIAGGAAAAGIGTYFGTRGSSKASPSTP